jgi:glycosyltransferase involved in cell wall biosynthesis
MGAPPVSFVVIAYNEAANISRTLGAIVALDGLDDYEIIVVNDGSRDKTSEIVANITIENPNVRLIDLTENCGRGYARKRGLAAARGEIIATVDADIVLPPHWLVTARAALQHYDAVGGTAVPDGDVAYIYKRFKLMPRVVNLTTTVTGSNGLYRRTVFHVANFDPELREGEDSALNYAMEHQGLSFATISGLVVQHEENKGFGTSLKWLFDVGRGATRQLFTYRKVRQPDIATGAFIAMVMLGVTAVANGFLLIGLALPAGFVLSAGTQHVRSRFEISWSGWLRFLSAVVVDCTLLTAYFVGRLAGMSVLLRRGLVKAFGVSASPVDYRTAQEQ